VIRVVADANVLVSAALARDADSPPAVILDAVLDGRIELVTSPQLLVEIGAVLARPRMRRYLSLEEAERFVGDLASLTALHADAPLPHPAVCRDPADDYLLALAAASGVEAIVSGDLDLLSLEQTDPVVVTPRALLERMAAER
jgi:putative PIN family toxin of toxin-antitoxin system